MRNFGIITSFLHNFIFSKKATECADGWTLNFVKKFLIVNFLQDDEVGLSKIGIISGIHQN